MNQSCTKQTKWTHYYFITSWMRVLYFISWCWCFMIRLRAIPFDVYGGREKFKIEIHHWIHHRCHRSVMIWMDAYSCLLRPWNPEPCPSDGGSGAQPGIQWVLVGNHSVVNREAVYKVVSFSLRQLYCNDLGCWWTYCEIRIQSVNQI